MEPILLLVPQKKGSGIAHVSRNEQRRKPHTDVYIYNPHTHTTQTAAGDRDIYKIHPRGVSVAEVQTNIEELPDSSSAETKAYSYAFMYTSIFCHTPDRNAARKICKNTIRKRYNQEQGEFYCAARNKAAQSNFVINLSFISCTFINGSFRRITFCSEALII